MNRSSSPGKATSHHHQGALPFSIDHILSSPIKQAAADARAANQQQQTNELLSNLIATNQDALSTAMLNEQLALLASQQHHHLLNPAALAAAAAAASTTGPSTHLQPQVQPQPHQHQQWQQQQLMATAAAAAAAANFNNTLQSQTHTNINPLNPLIAAGAHNNQAAQPNFLSYFMAYMLLQQQQQQQQEHQSHQLSQLQALQAQRSALNNLNSVHMGNSITNLLNSSQYNASDTSLKHSNKAKSSAFESPLAGAGVSSSSPSIVGSRRSPGPLMSGQNHQINYAHSHQVSYQHHQEHGFSESSQNNHNNKTSGATSNRQNNNNKHQLDTSNRSLHSKFLSGLKHDLGYSTAASSASSSGQTATIGNKPINIINNNNNNSEPTAISSLTNFVFDTLAPIDETQRDCGSSKFFKSSRSSRDSVTPDKSSFSIGSIVKRNSDASQHRKSGSAEPEQHNRGSSVNNRTKNSSPAIHSGVECNSNGNKAGETTPLSALDMISSASQAPKALGSTINTTLAKAPPELVSKQPAWVFCTRYSDRPSSGPRTRRLKSKDKRSKEAKGSSDEKRPRTAFTSEQLEKLRLEFQANSYLDERRRKDLADRLCLNENQIKIWFQNKRAKMKKQNNQPNPLRGLLVAGGLYNHSTATSDCSESYANGNDEVEVNEDADEIIGDFRVDDMSNANVSDSNLGDSNRSGAFKRKRSIGDDGPSFSENGAAENGAAAVTNNMASNSSGDKKLRLHHGGSSEDSSEHSSQMDDALDDDEDERVSIS